MIRIKNIYNYSNFIGYVSYIPSNLENFEDKSSHLEVLKRYLQVLRPSRLDIGGRNEVSPYPYDQSKSAQWIPSGKLTLCYWTWPFENLVRWFTHQKWCFYPPLFRIPKGSLKGTDPPRRSSRFARSRASHSPRFALRVVSGGLKFFEGTSPLPLLLLRAMWESSVLHGDCRGCGPQEN